MNDIACMEYTKSVSSYSQDPSIKVGAALVDCYGMVMAHGYNRFPFSIASSKERLNNRDIKYKLTLHAEQVCINNALANKLGRRLGGGETMYVYPVFSCASCASLIIDSGIREVVYPLMARDDSFKEFNARWSDSIKLADEIFNEAGVNVRYVDFK